MKKMIILGVAAFFLIFPNLASAQYHVEAGDTMYKIAQKHSMTLKDLLLLNPHITNPSSIYPKQHINIRSKDTAQDIVDYARSLQDQTRYVYGADYKLSPNQADCSSWTKHIYAKFGIDLPRVSWQQAKTGTPLTFEQLKKGDLMFFGEKGKVSHVGIYMGDDYWISNLSTGKDVVILSKWGSWSYSRFLWGSRVL